jgi:hypothetical protein
MKPKSFYLPTYDNMTVQMLLHHGHRIVCDGDGNYDAAVFTGGADICPLLYGELPIPGVKPNLNRDRLETAFFKGCPTFKPKIGICRGAQFLNVLSGGKLWQDVDNHTSDHTVDVLGVGRVKCTSTHHQMMIAGDQATLVATANEAREFKGEGITVNIPFDPDNWTDPEIIYYWNTNSLCFQPHPEYKKGECQELFMLCIKDYLFEPAFTAVPKA